ncbi:sigma-70 family RNA polymerase sigma factor [Brevibacterium spongiae]|uniref:Sigma-70 family RNA polymerase sigma factor n=1 Tax=Brevibacterium spongiae TaxID=2909672 RepID=A0ABY5SPY0_9MICO|nr:sigma-70 family RNA polymerase sigma factor [Brevibacterium spongiae]UVI36593.1 sigma-70 family RNA polymerase sigma factor [Brevibacterium spongiae]
MPSDTPPQTLADVADQFASYRPKMFAIAHRTLGSPWAADDAVQEAWIRLQRADIAAIDNLEAWLTTVISRVCIDAIRRDAARREDLHWEASDDEAAPDHDPAGEAAGAGSAPGSGGGGGGVRTDSPEDSALLRDDLTVALHVILDTLGPLERLALVLHDIFALSYDDIAPIVDRSPVAARQLASRARARLRKVDAAEVRYRQETAITSFLEAARGGDFGGLLQLLDPEIKVRSDPAAVSLAGAGAEFGAPLIGPEIIGSDAVARVFNGRAKATRLVHIDGVPAAAYVSDGVARALYLFRFAHGRVAFVEVIADEETLSHLAVTP